MSVAWKDMTKEQRAEKIKAGQSAAKQRRTEVTPPDVSALVAAEVAKALAGIRTVQAQQEASPDLAAIAKKDPRTWTDADRDLLKKEHERLQNALAALPYKGEEMTGAKPGSIVGEGFNKDYVPYTAAWFLDVEARRKDRNRDHLGREAELTWPDYKIENVYYQGTNPWLPVTINGVTFNLLPGIPCMLPTPHFASYMRSIQAGKKNDENFQPPAVPGTGNGYYYVSPKTGLAVILGKGPLASIEEREANDAPSSAS